MIHDPCHESRRDPRCATHANAVSDSEGDGRLMKVKDPNDVVSSCSGCMVIQLGPASV
jgi:hypothetical protein